MWLVERNKRWLLEKIGEQSDHGMNETWAVR